VLILAENIFIARAAHENRDVEFEIRFIGVRITPPVLLLVSNVRLCVQLSGRSYQIAQTREAFSTLNPHISQAIGHVLQSYGP